MEINWEPDPDTSDLYRLRVGPRGIWLTEMPLSAPDAVNSPYSRKAILRNGETAIIWLLPKHHVDWGFPNPFGLRGYIGKSIQQWCIDGKWCRCCKENPLDIVSL